MPMKKWKASENYGGRNMAEYYILCSKTRDSGILERSNFDCILEAMGGEQEGSVEVHQFSHWACGWIEAIMVHASDVDAVARGNDIAAKLERYPVFDNFHFCEMQTREVREYWQSESISSRVDICCEAGVSIFAARREEPVEGLREYLEEGM